MPDWAGSAAGVAGILFTAFFMVLRLLDGSYLPGGPFALPAAAAAAKFDVHGTSLLKCAPPPPHPPPPPPPPGAGVDRARVA